MSKRQEAVILEPVDTPLGEFQKERTEAISEMFDDADELGLYPTTKFFVRLDNCVRKLLQAERAKLIRQIETIGYDCPYGHNHICLHRDEYETMVKRGCE